MIQIAVVNASTEVSEAEAERMVHAVQIQVSRDWAPAWGVDARLFYIPRGTRPPAGMWWQTLLDDADQAGALGYHDLTAAGLPLGKVFAKTVLSYGGSVSVTLSHEVLEMLGDPDVNLLVQKGDRGYAYEVCDAVEDDPLGYEVFGCQVSDFVYPEYFETFWAPGATQFDYMRHLHGPLPAMADGGYLAYVDFTTGRWNQIDAHGAAPSVPRGDPATRRLFRQRPHVGSRRQRRALPPATWLRSTVEAAP